MTPLPQLNDSEFQQLQRMVYNAAGIAITPKRRTLLNSRVRRRVAALGLNSFRQYLSLLDGTDGSSERLALLDAVSTNETSFFRTPAHFRWFTDQFLVERAAAGTSDPLRIWSAACSTGEEAYSLAIKLSQHQPRLANLQIELYATDLSAVAIERACEGVYPRAAVAKLEPQIQPYFRRHRTGMQLVDSIRDQIQFGTHNLMDPAPHQELDCLFLRNVLIYFDPASRAVALANVIQAIRPGGYLVVGPSEGIVEIPDGLQRVQSFLFRRCGG